MLKASELILLMVGIINLKLERVKWQMNPFVWRILHSLSSMI
jgi:hypothetical protein